MSCVLTADDTTRSFVVILLNNTTMFAPRSLQPSWRGLSPFTFRCSPRMPGFLKRGLCLQHLTHKDSVAEALKQRGNREYNGTRDHEGQHAC